MFLSTPQWVVAYVEKTKNLSRNYLWLGGLMIDLKERSKADTPIIVMGLICIS